MNVELGGQLPLDASLWSELRSLQVGGWGSGDSCCALGGDSPRLFAISLSQPHCLHCCSQLCFGCNDSQCIAEGVALCPRRT